MKIFKFLKKVIDIKKNMDSESIKINKKISYFKNYQLKTTLNFHIDPVTCMIILKDLRYASSSTDNTIKIFNRETYEIEINITYHKNFVVYIIQINDGRLVSSSSDNTISIIRLLEKIYIIEQTLTNHISPVKKTIELNNGFLLSCSWDKTIKIWNKTNDNMYNLNQELIENDEIDSIFQINNNEIFSISHLGQKISFYQLQNNKLVFLSFIGNYSFSGFSNNFAKISENYFLIGGLLTLYFINIKTHQIQFIYNFDAYFNEKNFFQNLFITKDNTLYVGCETDILQFKISDKEDNLELIDYKKNIHEENNKGWRAISCIIEDNDNGDLITTSYDGTIKVWKNNN